MNWVKSILPYVIILLVVVFVRIFIVTPVKVNGDSMVPTLQNGDVLLLKKYDHSFDYYDIVVVQHQKKKIIKRVIGKPGDQVLLLDGKLYINQKEVKDAFSSITHNFNLEELGYTKIPDNQYLVMGDNRPISSDSRTIGLIDKSDIIGTTTFRLFPFQEFGKIGVSVEKQ